MSEVAQSLESEYDAQVDEWVLAAAEEHKKFAGLVENLPGIFPSVVSDSLRRQGGLGVSFGHSEKLLRLDGPIPHPRDGDWRFHPESYPFFAKLLAGIGANDVAVLACPSIVKPLATSATRIVLADSNEQWKDWLPAGNVDASWGDVSLAAKRWPHRFDAVIMDPPWYPFEFARFLSVAAALLRDGAALYVSFPSLGTRPGIRAERERLLHTARRLGLVHVSTRRSVLRYATPFYEGCALVAGGLPVLAGWRFSDLVTFKRVSSEYTEQMEPHTERWHAATLGRLQLRIKPSAQRNEVCDPRLISVVDGDVLPSVSQRDKRRDAICVWTGGNRIFGCVSTEACYEVAAATMQKKNPVRALEERFVRPMTAAEIRNILETQTQLADLEAQEARLYDEMHENKLRTSSKDQTQAAEPDGK
jgi:hypothetical protein